MASITSYFATEIYRAELPQRSARSLNEELAQAIRSLAVDDEAGRKWAADNGYIGYTSYASLDDLPWRFPPFATLKDSLDAHAARFADALAFDLRGTPLELDSLWVNLLADGGGHSGHIHPHSVLSGTYYVEVPEGASPIRFEDPRLVAMMARPPLKPKATRDHGPFIYLKPKPGTVLIWESWLRHEVPVNTSDAERMSVSFNYRWGK